MKCRPRRRLAPRHALPAGAFAALVLAVALTGPAIAAAVPVPPPAVPVLPPAADPAADDSLDVALERELERADAALQRAARHAGELEARRERLAEDVEAGRSRLANLDARVQILAGGGEDADRLYDEIVEALEVQRTDLAAALDGLRGALETPTFSPRLELRGLGVGEHAQAVADLRERYDRIAERLTEARRGELALRWERVRLRGELGTGLNAVRIDALGRLSPRRRRELLGLSRDGVAQMRREADHLALTTRLWIETRLHGMRAATGRLGDMYAVGSAGLVVLKGLGVLVLWLLVRLRIDRWLDAARRSAGRMIEGGRRRRRLDSLFGGLRALAPWGAFLLALYALRRALGPVAEWPEFDLLLQLAMLYGGYRLVIDALTAFVLGIARRYRLRVDEARTTRVLYTVRSLTRFAFGLAVLLTVAAQFLGRGALYHLVTRAAFVLLAILLLRLVSRWRETIADTYLHQDRSGPLTPLVRRTRDRWYGMFVAVAALIFLAARGAAVMARDFALGFDQTRRALAFVFRRKMEKQAALQGYADVEIDDVPREIREAFSQDPVGAQLSVEHFPGHDLLAESVERWYSDGTGGSFMITGEFGGGKSSWLARARQVGAQASQTPWTVVTLDDRLRSSKRLASTLADALGFDDVEGDLKALEKRLLDGPQRRIVLDRTQNLYLGVVGGFRTMETFVNLMEATCRRVYWLCAMDVHAWNTLISVRPDLNVFRRSHRLERWSEEHIRELIRVRSEACGLEVTYDDLFADRLDRMDARARSEETDRGYTRLLWDYSDGNPRCALHFWLRSLVPDGPTRARVRLFRSPDAAEIEPLGEQSLFLLAAIAGHENLTVREAAEVTRYPAQLCRIRFERMRDLGILTDDENRARITTHWQRVVLRTLRRRNLLAS